MEVKCSICGEIHDDSVLCSGCMGKIQQGVRIPGGINPARCDTRDWQYLQLLELHLSGQKLRKHELKMLNLEPGEALTIEQAKRLSAERIKLMLKKQAKQDKAMEAKKVQMASRNQYQLY